uniref:Serine/threonine-protein phosphatase PGAM5, mitochondrial n=1 Tax=Heterorhabditis bacteriophora TaxID=37862 RepID=A0A1I7XD38_HETBA
MVVLRKIIYTGIPLSGLLVAGYTFSDVKILRNAMALSKGTKKSFDEHFPRGTWDDNWDFRSPDYLLNMEKYNNATEEEKRKMYQEVKATATRNILLIRHGQYHLDSEGKNLTPLGREQASLLGKRLAESGIKFDKLVMSTMQRATETANLILQHIPELQRCVHLEGPPYPPVPPVHHWRPQYSEFFVESARIESAFRRHIHRASPQQKDDSFEIIVCHANVIRYFICRFVVDKKYGQSI